MCLDETYSIVLLGKHLSNMLPIKNDFKQGDTYHLSFSPSFRICHYEDSGKPGWLVIKLYTSPSSLC